LKNLYKNKMFALEEMDTLLRNYEDFVEGGARIQIEEGRPPTLHELALKVAIFKQEDKPKDFYISSNATVQEA